ncbi:translation initiation factor IF-2 subunit gamma [Candidatus Woesearchaeota archaeon]|nr:translation initiation factor IF-2 subunit gamma [Candidatus Woesearchaeota archaeon]
MVEELFPEINIGLVGHVDHGKTTLVSKLSGKWTDIHSEEIKRGITIKLGYADAIFYRNDKLKGAEAYSTKPLPGFKPTRKVSFIDAPGHETLMATMLSGAAIIDAALLLVSANEPCPQPQTEEHLMALEILGIKNIIIVQNKIDLVTKEDALQNYKDIKEFTKGTIAENSSIVPISAQHNININFLIETIEREFKTPKRDLKKDPLVFIARSFDINRPGTPWDKLNGGILGGAIKQGTLKIGDEIEILPGLRIEEGDRPKWKPITTKIVGLKQGGISTDEVKPGGSIGILTQLDPSIVKSDNLIGNVTGYKGKLPKVWHELTLKPELLKRVVGSKEHETVEGIKKGENLVLNVNSAITLGIVNDLKKDSIYLILRIPICAYKTDRVTISRRVGMRWRLIGVGTIIS